MRYRRYRPCEAHPLHSDTYEAAGSFLVATALLWLSDTEEGGETLFPFAVPAPLLLQPRRGRMGVWLNYRPDGTVDRSAMHEALPVIRGEKITLTAFLYAPIDAVPAFARDLRDEPDIPGVQVADFARQPG